MKQTVPIYLASASPRRREILTMLGLSFSVEVSEAETPAPAAEESSEDGIEYVPEDIGYADEMERNMDLMLSSLMLLKLMFSIAVLSSSSVSAFLFIV